ncbi:MAG: hypothetical protein GXP15_14110 [Gammaproteobacteria bacterium]|nr:hypothetical protein [Gammaproteobacteria bacterium]
MFVFEWIEETRLALWVGESLWGYPILLSLHIIGLAAVAGIFTMLDFRLLGIVKEIAFQPLVTLFGLAWVGLIINTISGIALFTSQAVTFATNIPFLIKIASIIIGTLIAIPILRSVRENGASWDAGESVPDSSVRMWAVASLVCWTFATFGGRLIAYL